MSDAIATFGCNGCPCGFEVIAESRSQLSKPIEEAKKLGIRYSIGDDGGFSASMGKNCGNELTLSEFRCFRECYIAEELSTVLDRVMSLDLVYELNT